MIDGLLGLSKHYPTQLILPGKTTVRNRQLIVSQGGNIAERGVVHYVQQILETIDD